MTTTTLLNRTSLNSKKYNAILTIPFVIALLTLSNNASAISCSASGDVKTGQTTTTVTRTWSLDQADACDTGPGNPNSSSDIESLSPGNLFNPTTGTDWTKQGDVTASGDASSLLDIILSGGTWGDQSGITGRWSLTSDFWDDYGAAVISVHVGGNAGGKDADPDDHAAFYITSGQIAGTFAYDQTPDDCCGGGLSNFMLWTGSGSGVKVSEPGTLAIFGLGLVGFMAAARRRKSTGS